MPSRGLARQAQPRAGWLRLLFRDQPRQPEQIVGGAAEDEGAVDLGQSAHLHLGESGCLLQPAEGLLDQPAATQADAVTSVPCRSAVHDRASALMVFGHMRRHVQGSCGSHEVLGVVGLVCAHGDAPRTALLLVGQHQQRGFALGVAIGLGGYRGSDQAVAVLHQRMAQIGQFGLPAVALFVQPRVRVGGRFMRLVGLSITHKLSSEDEADLDVSEPCESSPHDCIPWWRIFGSRQIASEAGEFGEVDGEPVLDS